MLRVDTETCIGCGLCEETCTFGAISVVDGVAVVNESCTLCGACVDVCETGALAIQRAERASDTDLAGWSGVMIFAEFRQGRLAPVALELLGIGRELADNRDVDLAAVLFGSGLDEAAATLVGHGADRVYLVDDPTLDNFTDDIYANLLADQIRASRPEIVLAGATAIGRSFIPRVASLLGTGLTADCTALAIDADAGLLLQTRPAFGGNIMATIVCPHTRPQMATVRPRVMKAIPFDPDRQGAIIPVKPESKRLVSRTQVIKSVKEQLDQVNITEAEIIVSGGRGLDNQKGFELISRLAAALGGAVGASRAAVDSGWIAYPHQVGQTGKTVNPKVYIACGISGAIQHIVGMASAEVIIAINKDPDAPIFDVATYGIVGDLFEVIPLLIQAIEERKG